MHGVEHTKAAAPTAASHHHQRMAIGERTMAAGTDSQGAGSRTILSRSSGTIPGIIDTADRVHSLALDRLGSISALSGRALDLVTKLGGPFDAPASDRGGRSPNEATGPASALEAAQARVEEIGGPLRAMDPCLDRLAEALDALDRLLS